MSSEMMELGSESRFTGLVLFHRYVRRFYSLVREQKQSTHQQGILDLSQEIRDIGRHLGQVASACLFLGCKMSEEPRRIRDVINLSSVLGFCDGDSPIDFSKDTFQKELVHIKESAEPPALDDKYWKSKEEVVSMEQLVLRMLQFDTIVCHPHRCVLVVMETLGFGTGVDKTNGAHGDTFLTPEQSTKVISDAWRLLNEAAIDPEGSCLIYPVTAFACAVIQVAADGIGGHADAKANNSEGSYQHIKLPESWWRALDVTTGDIQTAISSILKLID